MAKKESKKKESEKVPEPEKFKGPARNFRFRNPEGHDDKYKWITLRKGDFIPKEVQPILAKEAVIQKTKDRVKELEKDLEDDGKKNNSQNEEKKSPGRKKK